MTNGITITGINPEAFAGLMGNKKKQGWNPVYAAAGIGFLGAASVLAYLQFVVGQQTKIKDLMITKWGTPDDTEIPTVNRDLDMHISFKYLNNSGDTSWYYYGYAYPSGEIEDAAVHLTDKPTWAAYGADLRLEDNTSWNWREKDDEEARHGLESTYDGITTDGILHGMPGDVLDVIVQIWNRRCGYPDAELIGYAMFPELITIGGSPQAAEVRNPIIQYWEY